MSKVKPQVIDDEEHERVHDRVAAADVAKDTGVVCTRTPHRSRPGARQSAIWTVRARMGAIRTLGRQLKADGIEMVTLESASGYWRIWFFVRCVDVLRGHQARRDEIRQAAGSRWHDNDLVFPSQVGTPADASHVRRSFRKVVEAAGLDTSEWTPRELRHSFVSLLSDADVPIEHIFRLVGHSSTTTTETI